MNIQEFATLAELRLNVKIILLDNGGFGLVRQQQELFYGRRFVASAFERPSDFVAIARAFGIVAVDLGQARSPESALRTAMSAAGPILIRVPVDVSHHVLPMVAPGAANIEALDHPRTLARPIAEDIGSETAMEITRLNTATRVEAVS